VVERTDTESVVSISAALLCILVGLDHLMILMDMRHDKIKKTVHIKIDVRYKHHIE
jgi:hypothetical protein